MTTRPLTVRLTEDDYDRLETEAGSLGMRPGTLAKVLLHASLAEGTRTAPPSTNRGLDALDRLAELTKSLGQADPVDLVARGRADLDRRVGPRR